jgi:hypothetical protein
MKKLKELFGAILFASFILSSCGNTKNEKPKLCDCQNYWWKDVEDAMYYGKTEPSDFVNECGEFYTVEEMTNANCGLTKYDPNFKAK